MSLIKLDRQKNELLGKLKAIADSDTELSDGQREESMMVRAKLDSLQESINHNRYINELEKKGAEAATPKPADYRRARRDFSITKLIANELLRAKGLKEKFDTGMEREVTDELASHSELTYEGIPIPLDALMTRAVTTALPATGPGSRIIDDDYRPQDYIPLLRNALVTRQLGATFLMGLMGGTVKIPKAKSGMVASWAGENDAFSTDDLEFETPVSLEPKKLGVVGEFSRYMMLQANPDIEQLFRRDLTESLARTTDQAAIMGSETNAPKGITGLSRTASRATQSQLMSLVAPTDQTGASTDGKIPLLADWIQLFEKVDTANVPMQSRAILINYKTKYRAMQQVLFSNTDSKTLYGMGMLLDQPTVVSNIIRSDNAKGAGTGLSTAIYGNWSDLLIGVWEDLDLLINPYESSAYNKGAVKIRAVMVCDSNIRRTESFAFYNDIKTTA